MMETRSAEYEFPNYSSIQEEWGVNGFLLVCISVIKCPDMP